MFYRKIYDTLVQWKSDVNKVALCLTGARQVGKTTLVRYFAKQHYSCFIEINFFLYPELKKIFSESLDANSIITKISAFFQKELIVGKTLIFFDEIQECPNARTAIKFLVEDGRFDYIESGSLLGVRVKEIPSLPVGFERQVVMYPMDLYEFSKAIGVDDAILDRLEENFKLETSVDDVLHNAFIKIFRTYLVVGGMPAAVFEYIQSKDIAKVVNVQRQIVDMYRLDISRYSVHSKDKIHAIFDAIPAQLEEKNRRFFLSFLDKHARMNRYENSFMWLNGAGVANPCFNVTSCIYPLKLNEKRNIFKLFMSDTGLLASACAENVQYPIFTGDRNINLGGILENMIAQQLLANGFSLHYYDSLKNGAVDFVVEKDSCILPIEVKSGKDYKRHNALENVLNVKDWNLKKAYVLCSGNLEKKDNIVYLPWYMVMFIKQSIIPENTLMELDLNELFELQNRIKENS